MHPRDFVRQTYIQRFGNEPDYLAMAPGRVNLLGEHVDYNDGFVLPAAIDRATYVAFSAAEAGVEHSTILAADFGEVATFTRESIFSHTDAEGKPLSEWARYPAGVAWALAEAGLAIPPMQAVFASDIPRGAGLSSSSSVELAFGTAWSALGGWSIPPMELAKLGQRAENLYVGVNCGIMDQFASACGVADKLLLLDCRSLEWQTLPIPENIAIVIADTSVRRKLTSSEYNARRGACEEAVSILKQDLPSIRALRDVSVEDFNRYCRKLPKVVEGRARHVVEEVERTLRAIPLLQEGDVQAFGQIMNQCHVSLRDLYEVSIPELNIMVDIAQSLPGCLGARLTGAGFGGCTVNLVEKEHAEAFAIELAASYTSKTNLKPEIYICRISDGAKVIPPTLH
ncbi:MAG TPA: galactokinase [Anaerolineales bacterium]|nr:galactokinase [Anaerolineales bacterium]